MDVQVKLHTGSVVDNVYTANKFILPRVKIINLFFYKPYRENTLVYVCVCICVCVCVCVTHTGMAFFPSYVLYVCLKRRQEGTRFLLFCVCVCGGGGKQNKVVA